MPSFAHAVICAKAPLVTPITRRGATPAVYPRFTLPRMWTRSPHQDDWLLARQSTFDLRGGALLHVVGVKVNYRLSFEKEDGVGLKAGNELKPLLRVCWFLASMFSPKTTDYPPNNQPLIFLYGGELRVVGVGVGKERDHFHEVIFPDPRVPARCPGVVVGIYSPCRASVYAAGEHKNAVGYVC